jgi:TonB family protein
MKSGDIDLTRLKIAAPCAVPWESMTGDNRVRFCEHCSLHVYNISEMSALEAMAFVRNRNEKLKCVRFFRRSDGTILTRDCSRGVRIARDKCLRFWQKSAAAALFFCSLVTQVFAQSSTGSVHTERRILVSPVVPPDTQSREHNLGQATMGAISSDFGPYMTTMQRRINAKWHRPANWTDDTKTVVSFNVDQGGKIARPKVIHSSGDDLCDQSALNAINDSVPFMHLPSEAGKDVEIEFTFDAKLLRDAAGSPGKDK